MRQKSREMVLAPLDGRRVREESLLCVFELLRFLAGTMSESPSTNASRNTSVVKRALVEAGFEVFRTRGEEILLAERPRENLIMDSGVRLRVTDPLEVRVVMRAQKADFPNEDEPHLFDRVRQLAAALLASGFAEVGTMVTRIADPGDAERTLDTFYEVTFAKSTAALPDALLELRSALTLEKRA